MNIPYFAIRLLTLLSYFLPFIFYLSTCTNNSEAKIAFNKKDAIKNERERSINELAYVDSLITNVDTNATNINAALTDLKAGIKNTYNYSDNFENLDQSFESLLFYPTNYSLSALGTIALHENMLGKITVSISLIISFLTLFFWFFIHKRKIGLYVITTNLVTLVIFIVDCLITNVSMLYGVWVLLFLLLVQLLTELKERRKIHIE